MTRINCVPVEQLSRQHLVAEYRELPRIFGMVRSLVERGITCPKRADIPPTYRMGPGHMKFFIDKLGWLVQRQKLLIMEMQRRGYAPQHTDPESLLDGIPVAFHGSWSPTSKDLEISWSRITKRLASRSASMAKWAAMQRYADGCGYVGCFGLESREAAIAWLQKGWDWSRCFYLSPSWEIWELKH